MIDRSYTLVTGPAGAGKTSLVEALIASNRSRLLAAIRVEEVAGLAEPYVHHEGNDETRRFEAAGTVDATLLRVPAGWRGDAFDVVDAVDDAVLVADAVLIEGNVEFHPRELDATVFIGFAGEPLLVEEAREVGRLDGRTALSLALGSSPADEEDEVLPHGLNVGGVIDENDESLEVVETIELPDDVSRALERLLAEGSPMVQRKRWLRPGFEALPMVDLVVVAVDAASDGAAARSMREEVDAVRRDEALRREVTGGRHHWPRSCHIADLSDRRGPGTTKVLQAVKRRWR